MHLHSEKTTNKKQTDIPMEYIANVKNISLAFPVWFITSRFINKTKNMITTIEKQDTANAPFTGPF